MEDQWCKVFHVRNTQPITLLLILQRLCKTLQLIQASLGVYNCVWSSVGYGRQTDNQHWHKINSILNPYPLAKHFAYHKLQAPPTHNTHSVCTVAKPKHCHILVVEQNLDYLTVQSHLVVQQNLDYLDTFVSEAGRITKYANQDKHTYLHGNRHMRI